MILVRCTFSAPQTQQFCAATHIACSKLNSPHVICPQNIRDAPPHTMDNYCSLAPHLLFTPKKYMACTICIDFYRVNFYKTTCPSGDISCPTYRECIKIDVLYLTTYMNFNSKKIYLSQVHVHAIHKSNKYIHENNTEMYYLINCIF